MHALFTDETNVTPSETIEFFAYGGLIIPLDKFSELHKGIANIRKEAGLQPEDIFKFDSHTRPKHVTAEVYTEAKRKAIQLAIATDCKFIVYVILHNIIKKTPLENIIHWGANHVIGKFNVFLEFNKSNGMVVVDRLSDATEYKLLSQRFCKGLEMSEDQTTVPLGNIHLFTSSCNNASHLSSLMDIVLGSFRYCINRPFSEAAAKEMMGQVTKLIWAERTGKTIMPFERGLIFRPKKVDVPKFQKKYDELLAHINSLLK